MALVVVYDACVLYPAPLRDLLLRLAVAGVVRARWSATILDETFRNLAAKRPDLSTDMLERTRALMNAAIPDCLVTGHERLTDQLALPDENDRHVLAAAIHAQAQAIVTFNRKDFPSSSLDPHGIRALHPDQLVTDLLNRVPSLVIHVVREQARALRAPPMTLIQLLDVLTVSGLDESVARMRELLG